jgi:hypothetical protein
MDRYAGTMSNWAYEMDDGHGGKGWILMNENGDVVDSHFDNDFATVIDFWRQLGYDTIINTYESWEAMDEYSS